MTNLIELFEKISIEAKEYKYPWLVMSRELYKSTIECERETRVKIYALSQGIAYTIDYSYEGLHYSLKNG